MSITPSLGWAAVQEIIAEGNYSMGDGETPVIAEEGAMRDAKKNAVEQAGTYVQSYSEIKKYRLTVDEVRVIASGIVEVTVLDKNKMIDGNSIVFHVKIKAVVNTDKFEYLASKLQEETMTEKYIQLQQDYGEIQQQLLAAQLQLADPDKVINHQVKQGPMINVENTLGAKDWFEFAEVYEKAREQKRASFAYQQFLQSATADQQTLIDIARQRLLLLLEETDKGNSSVMYRAGGNTNGSTNSNVSSNTSSNIGSNVDDNGNSNRGSANNGSGHNGSHSAH